MVTPLPTPVIVQPPNEDLKPTPTGLNPSVEVFKRQQIVTLSVTQSDVPTETAQPKQKFPVAIAIPALVGGMVLALVIFGLYLWIAKKRRRVNQVSTMQGCSLGCS